MINKSKQIFFVFLGLTMIVLINLNLVMSSPNNTDGNIELSVLANLALADSESSSQCQDCVTGGDGTQSCEYTIGIITWSVTCYSGYYACCKSTGASCCK